MTDEAGIARTNYVDGLGRLTQVTENGTSNTMYGYDVLDGLTGVTPSAGGGRAFVYSSLKRLTSAANPETGTVAYTYDENGNLKTRAMGGKTTSYTYDALDELTAKGYSDTTPAVSYTYAAGWRTGVSAGTVSSAYGYDAFGRVSSSSQTFTPATGPVATYSFPQYQWTLADGLSSETTPSGRTINYAYDNAGRVSYLSGDLNGTTAYAGSSGSPLQYAANGAVSSIVLGNGITESTTYNQRFQPTRIQAGSLLTLDYGYGVANNNGNVQSQTITRGSQIWTQTFPQYGTSGAAYDGVNRLIGVSESFNGTGTPWSQTYAYDVAGNRAVTAPPVLLNLATATNTNQYSLSTNRIALQSNGTPMPLDAYDASGNLTNQPGVGQFTYDAENRLSTATVGSATASYTYDGDGRRVKKTVGTAATVYVYDAMGELAVEYPAVSPTAGSAQYLTADALGTTRLVTDGSQGQVECHDYYPFGEEIGSGVDGRGSCFAANAAATEKKFTGKERDAETGLDYFGARYLSSAQGRFTSPDPLMASARASNPQTWNRYSYTLNNPLRFIDPDGLAEISVADCQKDSDCTVVSVNVILDKNARRGNGVSAAQLKAFNKVLQGAKSDLGNGKIALSVGYTSGEVTSSGVTGLDGSKVNLFLSDYVPTEVTKNATRSGGLNGLTGPDPQSGIPVSFISANNAIGYEGPAIPYFSFTNTVTHELLHNLSGDASRDNSSPVWHEFQIDRQASGLHWDISGMNPDQRARAKIYTVPLNPEAAKPSK